MDNFNFLNTKQDRDSFIKSIESFRKSLFKDSKLSLDKYFSPEQKKLLSVYIQEKEGKLPNVRQIEETVTKIQEDLKRIHIVSIQLAYTPTSNQIADLKSWFWNSYQKTVIVDVTLDSSLIAGAVVDVDGRVWDYSLKIKQQGSSII